MRPRKDDPTYRDWRKRGETALGAFFRSTPYQYLWGPPVLLVGLVIFYLRSL
jgi:hypothetical protein